MTALGVLPISAFDQQGQLQFPALGTNVVPATPVKRRGKSMSRRTGQDGHVEPSGKYWVARWWQDVPGQEKRRHMRARVCPISGMGRLSNSERSRRAREIIAESGANTVECFEKVVQQKAVWTFREQAACWLELVRSRKRKPVAPSTIEDWQRILKNWLNPHVGDMPLSEVNNGAMRQLVTIMSKAGLSPKTVTNDTGACEDGRCVGSELARRRALSAKMESRVYRHAPGRAI